MTRRGRSRTLPALSCVSENIGCVVGTILGSRMRFVLPLMWIIAMSVTWALIPVGHAQTVAPLRAIEEDYGVSGFGLALRKLPTVGSVLYITAHPDDENNALLIRLSRGEGYRTGLLTLTRGDGGQNEIGPELFEALGLLRSGELMATHRFDGTEQFFSRAFEFGYSFSVEETFQKWGREEILRDAVRAIRLFRPHIVLTLSPSGTGGGQHHQASAQLAAEAFRLANDPQQFPEQIAEGLRPWRPFRLFQSGLGMGGSIAGGDVRIQLGEYDPLLGETYAEMGARSRSKHRSQGMNVLSQPGSMSSGFRLANSNVDSLGIENSFFDGIDGSLQVLSEIDPNLESSVILLEGYIDWAAEAYKRSDFESAVKAVMTGLDFVRRMRDATSDPEALFLLARKEKDFLNAAEKGHFLYFDVLAEGTGDGNVVPGEEFRVNVTFYNRSSLDVEMESVDLLTAPDWAVIQESSSQNQVVFRVRVPETAGFSEPYWRRDDLSVDRFSVKEGFSGIEAFSLAPVRAKLTYSSGGVSATLVKPAQHRFFDAASGREARTELSVVPRLSVSLSPRNSVIPLAGRQSSSFQITVKNLEPGPGAARLRLDVPAGWTVRPTSVSLEFTRESEERSYSFSVRPPAGVRKGSYEVHSVVEMDGMSFDSGFKPISYSHIETRHFYYPAKGSLSVIDVRIPANLRVGYVMGVGDGVGLATEQLGAQVKYLTAEELSLADLSQFDVIVTGVRAYLGREDLIANNHRLLEYVKAGGHLLVQYNKYEFLRGQYAPYPVRINRPHDRVTVEESPIRILQPNHRVFNFPNKIADDDWSDWVQERGLYFLGEWDESFTPLLELQDPWPYNNSPKQGALVVAQYGRGTYIYTGLAFFRQLPAGVSGAYRLWANLISLGKSR